ncbi:hypothetical protein OKA05_01270 [Luteolibacter arcticus]|uniref:Lipoprotein n=1 Tax=Luteolibacter arcticus TaxID=1581411 RepID=A0ABT3GCM4_9BACT|nr:hypothetical protein [Luteolibacter arcticus]MCW1921163.1 hypothetical protein [Luteolibacter arcticus]
MKHPIKALGLLFAASSLLASVGCDRKEKVLDVKTPGGGIEIERDKKTGDVDIKVEEKR